MPHCVFFEKKESEYDEEDGEEETCTFAINPLLGGELEELQFSSVLCNENGYLLIKECDELYGHHLLALSGGKDLKRLDCNVTDETTFLSFLKIIQTSRTLDYLSIFMDARAFSEE
ncbi:hypothetical protein HK098_000351 [Nowakowskiella sp. JEL0407]|nr:hypothetical protein HK098_000351 [Nowakowskiella sp. JEL0407]